MSRDTLDTEYGTPKYPPSERPSLILRIGLVLFTILILLASQELWCRYIVFKSNAERLEVLKQFIYNSEKKSSWNADRIRACTPQNRTYRTWGENSIEKWTIE